MRQSTPNAITCPACGAPLTPEPSAMRARCGHCGTSSEIATEGTLRVARALASAGIRVPKNPLPVEQIEAEIRERDEAMRARQRSAVIMLTVALVVLAAVAGLSMFAGR